MADVVPLPGKEFQPMFNQANKYCQDVYEEKLRRIGYGEIKITSIRNHEFIPYSNFIRRRLRLWNVKSHLSIAVHRIASSRIDYIIVLARKPFLTETHRRLAQKRRCLCSGPRYCVLLQRGDCFYG